jgi:hypothetical protein
MNSRRHYLDIRKSSDKLNQLSFGAFIVATSTTEQPIAIDTQGHIILSDRKTFTS